MKNNPLITVIIPTYNRSDKIGAAINSVLNQTYQSIQLIVVDDGSEDDTKTLMKQFPAVEFIIQKHAGQAAARNNGLRRAKGVFIASLDSDDVWQPNFLQHCVEKIERDDLDFVFTNWIQQSHNNTTRNYLKTYPLLAPYVKKERQGWIDLDSANLKAIYLKGCPSPSSSALVRKSSLVSGWNEMIQIGDDWCLFLDMILNKECKAAISMDQLWTKNVNDLNIYDGRAWNEITELLYVRDVKRLIVRYKNILNEDEIKELQALHLRGMLSLAIYHLFKKGNIRLSSSLVKRSFSLNAYQSIKMFPEILKVFMDRQFTALEFPFLRTNLNTHNKI